MILWRLIPRPPTYSPLYHTQQTNALVEQPKQIPFWALVSFGAYLLFKLGWGVVTFNDVPEAHAELLKEIDVARKDLRKKGVDVD